MNYQKVVYSGKLGEYQTKPSKFIGRSVFEQDAFNAYQNFLYKRALFGLSVYSEEELAKMHWDKKKRIEKVHARAQQVLNSWKQELTFKYVSGVLANMFYHSQFVKDYKETFAGVTDPEYISRTEFKDLGIKKEDIVSKLITERILPPNFYQLKAC